MTSEELNYLIGLNEYIELPASWDEGNFADNETYTDYYLFDRDNLVFDLARDTTTSGNGYNSPSSYKAVGLGDLSVSYTRVLQGVTYVDIVDIVFYSSLWQKYVADYYLWIDNEEDVPNVTDTSHYRVGYDSSYFYGTAGYFGSYSGLGIYGMGTYLEDIEGNLIQATPTRNPYGYAPMDSQNPAMYSLTLTYTASSTANFSILTSLSLYATNSLMGYAGYKTGFGVGYNQGLTDGGAEGTSSLGGTFSLLGNAFGSLAGLMETQVIGGLTIGALVGIPICVTIIVTLFKMMKK